MHHLDFFRHFLQLLRLVVHVLRGRYAHFARLVRETQRACSALLAGLRGCHRQVLQFVRGQLVEVFVVAVARLVFFEAEVVEFVAEFALVFDDCHLAVCFLLAEHCAVGWCALYEWGGSEWNWGLMCGEICKFEKLVGWK